MLNLTATGTGLWDTSLVTCFQLAFETQTSWPGHSAHLHSTSLSTVLWEMMSKAFFFFIIKVNNIQCSPLVHQASHFIVEGYQVGQSRDALCTAMLTTHEHAEDFGLKISVVNNSRDQDFFFLAIQKSMQKKLQNIEEKEYGLL